MVRSDNLLVSEHFLRRLCSWTRCTLPRVVRSAGRFGYPVLDNPSLYAHFASPRNASSLRRFLESRACSFARCTKQLAAGFGGTHVETEGWDSHVYTSAARRHFSRMPSRASGVDDGNKRVLYIPRYICRTNDDRAAGAPPDAASMMQHLIIHDRNSFGQTSMTPPFTGTGLLPPMPRHTTTPT